MFNNANEFHTDPNGEAHVGNANLVLGNNNPNPTGNDILNVVAVNDDAGNRANDNDPTGDANDSNHSIPGNNLESNCNEDASQNSTNV
jgi:hypothetical protein